MWLTQSLHRELRLCPERIATIHRDRRRTVAESAERIARFAAALAAMGVCPGDRVAILALNSDRYHECLLAVPWCGGVVNPINTRWAVPEVAFALAQSGTKLLLVDDLFVAEVAALREQLPELRTVVYMGENVTPPGMFGYEQLIAEHVPCEDRRAGGDALFGLFYTGGTTGTPKAVMLTHHNLLMSALGALASERLITRGGRILHAAPMFHLADLGHWVLGNLVGSTHVTIPSFTTEAVVEAVDEHAITDVLLVPTMLRTLVDHVDDGARLGTVRNVLYGASPMPEDLLRRAMTLFGSANFTQVYGMTELACFASLLSSAAHDHPVRRRGVGKPALHNEIRIVDDADQQVACGTVGEVVVRGDNVTVGYWANPEATAAAVREGWLHTGDVGYLDADGYLYVVDRLKDMIITGGENVYTTEVENALTEHPAVALCAVFGLPDPQWGESVEAAVVLAPGTHASESELREHCRGLVAGYKVPRRIAFVDQMPLSGTGKVLKRELVKAFAATR
ncbi:fatty-acid--CoA ligase [Mycobacterium sherrisii]|uniref:Long-chain-fatty-acid--CoA ligase FadD13 n=1 Tax=Mycobacterium sherrisii TaxID=243061 RepID=A0A1E3SZR1_9MYCO|nr:long-chain-fatty-acid--CoA ligase [Mycobacterium sherrisii]ODR07083.1 fatty-acid--CoA ligase [Mycobacterium sherrisii]